MRTLTITTLAIAGVGLAAPALAHNEPAKATNLKARLVQAHAPCTAPNAMTSTGFPACGPEVQSDPACQFGEKGSGKMSIAVKGAGFVVTAGLKGLDSVCNGLTLTAVVSLRATTDDCPETACTADIVDLPLGTCTVSRGRCSLSGGASRGVFVGGTETGIELLGCGLKNGGARTFSCGILVP
jgi:hypothetical protein